MMTTATVTARSFVKIGLGGDAAKFERFGDVFLDGMLDFVKFLAGVEKAAGDGIVQERFAVYFKIGNLGGLQRLAAMLFVVERLAFARHNFVLLLCAGIGQESVNALADGNHFRPGNDGLAKLFRLRRYRIFFSLNRHRGAVYLKQVNKSGEIRGEECLNQTLQGDPSSGRECAKYPPSPDFRLHPTPAWRVRRRTHAKPVNAGD
jgi:hypothetical protein